MREYLENGSRLLIAPVLDLFITSSDTSLTLSLFSSLFSPSDDYHVFTKFSIKQTHLPPSTSFISALHSFPYTHSFSFLDDLKSCPLITNPPVSWFACNNTFSLLQNLLGQCNLLERMVAPFVSSPQKIHRLQLTTS